MNDELKLLVEWSSPWQEFVTAIRPALGRSPERLAGEARTGLVPYRGMFASWIVEGAVLGLAIMLSQTVGRLQPYEPPAMPKYDVIYFSGEELPRTEDMGGAQAGRSGRAGGQEGHHRSQTIRVARGESLRERVVDAPKLKLPQSDSAVANLLAFKPVPGPAPTEGLRSSLRAPAITEAAIAPTPDVRNDKPQRAPTLNANVIPPTPEAQRDKMRSALPLNAAIVPPSPSAPRRDVFVPVAGSQAVSVIPPPVSAPEQANNLHSRLTLPSPAVIAPPPTQIARDINPRGPGFGTGTLQNQVVPPPASMADSSSAHHAFNGLGNAAVVPPPAQLNGAAAGTRAVAGLGNANVVPPPVQVGGGSLQHPTITGLGGGIAAVPPAPTVSGGGSLSSMARGNRGAGLGGPMDAGSVAAPPSNNGGSGKGTGVVVSSQPGSKIGVPGNAGTGSLAMSPSGGDKPGLGGSGGGASIGRGAGPGSGLSGQGSGAAKADATKEGAGRGTETLARGGISPYPGPGGAGNGTTGKPPMPGVSVSGGSNIVTLPSFGADGAGPNVVARSSTGKDHAGPGITIVGSARSGGAFNFYGKLIGDKNYTIYIDTILGTAVMQYADPSSAVHPYAEDLVAPQPMRSDLPANLKPSRLVIACILDRSGALRNLKVLEPGGGEMTTKVLAALTSWKFRPVFRGDQPVEVNAILGFDIDTR
ncbi:MAG TPA: hypothetical protein VNZ03_30805 [Terriglobales bacterium]|nr:hypothetical protein [Terriglobales bacterium]